MGPTQDNLSSQEQTGQAQEHGLSYARFGRMMEEIRNQPTWRGESDKCVDYYDGNQLDADTIELLRERGMGPLIVNLVKPTVDVVLGMEAKTRSDWRVQADGDEFQDVAEALSSKLFEVEREARADRACSDAYASQIKAGVGWVEVSKQSDPFKYPYRTAAIHRREMFWDWLAQDPALLDARYKVRKRWFDAEQSAMFFPRYKDVLHGASQGWAISQLQDEMEQTGLLRDFDSARTTTLEDYQWREADQLLFAECWYRVNARGYVVNLPDGRVVELDMKNPVHVAGLAAGRLKPKAAVYQKMRMSVWAGPIRVIDRAVKRNADPYIPFFGYREDLTGIPYGLIRSMLSPQDEINARRQKLMWLLSARRVVMDSDALDKQANTIQEMLEELARADAVVQLNANRKNLQGAFNVDSNLDIGKVQFEIMKDAESSLQKAAGVYQAMLGDESNAKSGIAINSLVEQGSATLGEINDNYRFSRRNVGESLLHLIRDDLVGQQVDVVSENDGKRKIISLNTPQQDPQTGMQMLANDVARSNVKVALEDVPSTPAYRAQLAMMLTDVMKSLAPEIQAIIMPFYLESTEHPKRKQMVNAIRRAMNIPDGNYEPGQDPEKDALMQKVEELTQQLQQVMQSPELAAAKAKAQDLAAAASKKAAETDLVKANTAKVQAETENLSESSLATTTYEG